MSCMNSMMGRKVGISLRRTLVGTGLSFILLFVIVGCSNTSQDHAGMDMGSNSSFMPVNVELSFHPDQVKVNEKVMIEVIVTQNDMNVTEADKVMIEVVPSAANGKSVEILATNVGDGKYTVETTFDQADTYSITSHVTVGAMHTMPKKNLIVTK